MSVDLPLVHMIVVSGASVLKLEDCPCYLLLTTVWAWPK